MRIRSPSGAGLAPLLALSIVLPALAGAGDVAGGARGFPPREIALSRNLPIHFEPNQGQFDPRVKYRCRASGFSLFLTAQGAVIDARRPGGGTAVGMRFSGARPNAPLRGLEELPGRSHYFRGSDPALWRRNIPHYRRVRVEEAYPGVDVEYYGTAAGLEFDFVVQPGADPGVIEIEIEGAGGLALDAEGRAVLGLAGGKDLVLGRPLVEQWLAGRKVPIRGDYVLRGRRLGLSLGPFDRTKTLRIDPTLSYSTFLGGSGADVATAVAVDSSGKAYVTGNSEDSTTDFPTTGGAYDTTHNGGTNDVFVAKLAADGSSLEYSTFLGGSGNDFSQGITVDGNGKAYVIGYTEDSTTDFPTTGGAYDTTHNGGTNDAFVTKLSADGSTLDYSTFLGGTGTEFGYGIAVDSSDKAYVVGYTEDSTTDFPTTGGAFDTTHNAGSFDAFAAKLAADGASLEYSTFLGGSGGDYGYSVAVDSNGKAHVAGYTQDAATDFPATGGAFDTTHNGGTNDGFVAKLSADGASLDYATFLGGIGQDYGLGVAVDSSGKAYVTGSTVDGYIDFPTTVGAYDTTHNGSNDAYVAKIAVNGASLDYSTLLGGTGIDYGVGIAVDAGGYAVMGGYTTSSNYPTWRPFQAAFAGVQDCVLTCLRAGGDKLFYSSYHGGSGSEQAGRVAVDSSGNAYIVGITDDAATDLPVTGGAYDTTHNGGTTDGFLTKIGISGTAVRLEEFTASRVEDGPGEEGRVQLAWRTGFEVDNLGFHVWRKEAGSFVRVTPSLLAGSGLLAGERSSLGGFSYAFADAPKEAGASWWLEELDLRGERRWHGPARWDPRPAASEKPGSAEALSRFGLLRRRMAASPRGAGRRALTPPAPANATAPAFKIRVREEGWYRLRGSDLLAAGLPPGTDPARLRLVATGREAALRVIGGADHRLDPGDSLEFYGVGLETPWEDSRVYWLLATERPTRRLFAPAALAAPPPRTPAALTSFRAAVESRPRTIYIAALLNGDEENFFGPLVSSEPVDQVLAARRLAAQDAATLEVSLQGVTDERHRVSVALNGTPVGTVELDGKDRRGASFPVAAQAREGENAITLTAEGGEADVSAIDFVRLTYSREAVADDGRLRMTAAGGRAVTAGGFGSPNLHAVDVTDPWRPRGIRAWVWRRGGDYAVAFLAPGAGERVLYLWADGAASEPVSLEADSRSDWSRPRAGVDLAIVAHGSLLDAAEELRSRREADGLRAVVADVEDLYDEFNGGQKSPDAIRKFLKSARAQWQSPPRYLLLLGDASFDPRNRLGQGGFDLVPTKLVDTSLLETASDEWLGDLDGDGVAEVAVGRLPATTADEARAMVEKLLNHAGGGQAGALLVSGASEGFDFEAGTRGLAGELPADLPVGEVSRASLDPQSARVAMAAGLAAGPLLVSYFGHGSVNVWGGGLLGGGEARELEGPPCPLYLLMTCLNGFFHGVYEESLAEALLHAPGGALAVWASSGLTTPEVQQTLEREAVKSLLEGRTLGEAFRQAKLSVADPDVRNTWVLLGDPTLRLR